MQANSTRAIIAAFLANLGIAIAKVIGFIFTGASSMLAESIHSFADSSNQGLLILGNRLSHRKENLQHPFGFGRERYFWSFIVALIIFSLGSLFALYEGIEKVIHPADITSPQWAIGILSVAIVLEGFSMRTAIQESRLVKGDARWWEFIRRTKVPELPVVLLEDLGALIGLVLALTGVSLAIITENPRFDAIGSIAIGILLAVIAVILAIEMRSLLLGESASPAVKIEIIDIIEKHPMVNRLIHMRTEHIGPEELLVAVKIEMPENLTIKDAARVINELEKALRAEIPAARMIYIEPDIFMETVESR